MSLIYKIAYLNDLCSLFFALNFEFTSLLGDGKAWDCDSTKRIKSPKMIWKDSFILSVVPRVNGKRSAKGFGLLYLPLTWKAFLYCHSVVSRVFLTFSFTNWTFSGKWYSSHAYTRNQRLFGWKADIFRANSWRFVDESRSTFGKSRAFTHGFGRCGFHSYSSYR